MLKSQAELLKDLLDSATLENYPVIKCDHAEQVAAINSLSKNKGGQMRKTRANLGVPVPAPPDLNSSSYRYISNLHNICL